MIKKLFGRFSGYLLIFETSKFFVVGVNALESEASIGANINNKNRVIDLFVDTCEKLLTFLQLLLILLTKDFLMFTLSNIMNHADHPGRFIILIILKVNFTVKESTTFSAKLEFDYPGMEML